MNKIVYIRSSNIYDDSRATKEIFALLENKYKVIIFGWNRDGKASEKCEKLFEEYKTRIKCFFFNEPIDAGIGIKNIDKLLKWIHWVRKTFRCLTKVDAVHACNLDGALGILSYIKKGHVKLIYDIYDYYIDSHNIPSVLKSLIERMEISVINNAELTIICTEERKEQIAKASPKKLIVIHNSPDVENVKKEEQLYDYVYCGSLFSQRLLNELFTKYPENSDLHFAIAGYGKYEKIAKELDKKYKNFTYFGSVSYQDVLDIESKSKVISAIYEPSIRNHRLCAPNKFYEALALSKPVIVCEGTGIDKIVKKNNIGMCIKYSADEFYNALRSLISDDEKCKSMGKKAREIYDREYKWSNMKERLIKGYNKVIN